MSKTVLVLGGGFAGVEAAIAARRKGFDVTLVSERDFIYLYPVSIWIPVGRTDVRESRVSLEVLARRHGFRFVKGRVESIEPAGRRVQTDNGTMTADALIIAIGGGKGRVEGIENTLSICAGPDAAEAIRERVDRLVSQGSGHIALGFGGAPDDPSSVRGGPVFELLFNIDTMLRRRKLRDRFSLSFFAPMADPGKKMGDRALALLEKMFARRGIARRVGTKIAKFDSGGVKFADGTALDADLVLFTPAGKGLPLFAAAGLPVNSAGFIQTDDRCRVAGFAQVYAVGDAAAIEGPDWAAKQGHLAEAMARVAVDDIAASTAQPGTRGRDGYGAHVSILCVMDTGDGAALVRRTRRKASVVVLPIIGHWLKKGWGLYWKLSRLRRFPRLPGM